MNNPHDPVSQFRSNLKNWEMVAKYGPDFAEAPARILEKQEIIKPVTRLRRSKNHSVKKGKNLGKSSSENSQLDDDTVELLKEQREAAQAFEL